MKTIFEHESYEELNDRMLKLTNSSQRQWGKMDIAQMLHHLNRAMEAPLGKYKTTGKPIFFMKIFKSVLYRDKPFGHGDPTPKDFKITESYNFSEEKDKAISNLKEIFDRGASGTYLPHAFFGTLTNEQWGKHIYKHTDHHLRQFGV